MTALLITWGVALSCVVGIALLDAVERRQVRRAAWRLHERYSFAPAHDAFGRVTHWRYWDRRDPALIPVGPFATRALAVASALRAMRAEGQRP